MAEGGTSVEVDTGGCQPAGGGHGLSEAQIAGDTWLKRCARAVMRIPPPRLSPEEALALAKAEFVRFQDPLVGCISVRTGLRKYYVEVRDRRWFMGQFIDNQDGRLMGKEGFRR